jgi:hypothetical protein
VNVRGAGLSAFRAAIGEDLLTELASAEYINCLIN